VQVPPGDITLRRVAKLIENFGLHVSNSGYGAGATVITRLCNYTLYIDERRLIMKAKSTMKTLKAAAAAAGVAAVLVLPTGCASSAAGSGGLIGGATGGGVGGIIGGITGGLGL
jgi:hypothetical protein